MMTLHSMDLNFIQEELLYIWIYIIPLSSTWGEENDFYIFSRVLFKKILFIVKQPYSFISFYLILILSKDLKKSKNEKKHRLWSLIFYLYDWKTWTLKFNWYSALPHKNQTSMTNFIKSFGYFQKGIKDFWS